ncbi:LAFE_0E02344g1_1 [Lachancea fermentati]|uniref:LAFE_0E02344g1_1 n=1 Tax=Lachancea fermentati TaxID=4955 RepID=A0A1G4MCQ3_LACFM|nr:LAFE_0E02344g1_1 [Lachancea fermentati]
MVFNKLVSFQIDYAPQYYLTKYISTHSRLQLIHINNKASPIVEGFFAVGTECPTDSGVPHTLEHLIFMGSHNHPYKGLLDMAGNLCMSSTNAWTATDQTVYTLTTAGWSGFKKLLPIYLDHILNPTLSEHAFTTEVHHIDPDDLEDKGVVYSEMQAMESDSDFIITLEKQRQMFPEGSGYRSETGGLTANLRELTNDAVKKFHEDMYSPDNLCVIVVGHVPQDELLKIMENFDSELPEFKGNRKKPFVDTKESQIPQRRSDLTQSEVEFPEVDESQGGMTFAWIGEPFPSHLNDLGVTILMEYFTKTALAPFTKELIETADPLANHVSFDTDDFMRTIVNLTFYGVPTERLGEAKEKVLDVIQNHSIDLSRIRQVVENEKWTFVQDCERSPFILSELCITDFLYGSDDGKLLEESLKDLKDFELLLQWEKSQWQELLQRNFVDNRPVIVLGKPSSSLYAQLEEEQKTRLEERKASLGDQGSRALKRKLEDAIKANSKAIPPELLEQFVVDDPVKSIDFIETKGITTIRNPLNDETDELTRRVLNQKPPNFPFFLHLEHFTSEFVHISFCLNTTTVKDVSLLPLYHVMCKIFSFPMRCEDGSIEPFEKVLSTLKAETIQSSLSMGIQGVFTNLLQVHIGSRYSNYKEAVKWIKHCLYDMVFDEERISIFIESFLSSIVELKRSGYDMLDSLINRHTFTPRAMKKSTDGLFVKDILQAYLDEINNGNFETKVLPKLEILRDQLRANFNTFHILISGNAEKMGDIYGPWMEYFGEYVDKQNEVMKVPPVPRLTDTLSDLGKDMRDTAHIVTTPASESSYVSVISNLPSGFDYYHPDYPAIVLAEEYLGCVEGPLWNGIRGAGLAYDGSIRKRMESSLIEFSFYRAADATGCFQAAKEIVHNFAAGVTKFEPNLLPAALSSVLLSMAQAESDYFSLAGKKYADIFCRNKEPNYNKQFLEKLGELTADDLQRVVKEYFVDIFNPRRGAVFISCHPTKLDSIRAFLQQEGYDVSVEELEEDSDYESDDDSCSDSQED